MSEPSSRRTALAGAGAGVLALAALTPVVAAQPERSDVEIVEELLTFEHRLESAYAAALRRDAIDTELGELLRNQEREHIRALEQVLRGMGRRSPRATVPPPELGSALRGRDPSRASRSTSSSRRPRPTSTRRAAYPPLGSAVHSDRS